MPLPLDRQRRQNVPSFQIWAAFGVGWRSPIIFFPKNEDDDKDRAWRLNSRRYMRRCLLNKEVFTKLKEPGILFLQDGARSHTAKSIMRFFERHNIGIMEDYPASSPDCNPIEAMWGVLDQHIAMRMPTTVEELEQATVDAWAEIPQDLMDRYASGFQPYMRSLVKRKGL